MKTNEEIIDLGSWTTPKSWDELNLKTFQEIERYYSENDKDFDVRDVLHIFTNHTIDDINSLPMEFSEKLMNELSWLGEEPKYDDPRSSVKIDGEEYKVNVQEKLRTGEFVAVDTVMKQDKHNYAAILAILCRKQGEVYDSKFENEVLPSRIELFEKQPMMNVMPIITFFLTLWLTSKEVTQLYTVVEEGLNHIARNIETSPKIGVFRKQYMKWRIRTLRKSLKSIKST